MSKSALGALEERVSDLERTQKQDRREIRRIGRGCTLIIQCCAAVRVVLDRHEKAVKDRDGDPAPSGTGDELRERFTTAVRNNCT